MKNKIKDRLTIVTEIGQLRYTCNERWNIQLNSLRNFSFSLLLLPAIIYV